MSVSHHLTDETLQDYASGALPLSMETLIACHLTVCSACRARSDTADYIGGSMLNLGDDTPMRATVADILARRNEAPPAARVAPAHPFKSGVPRPLGNLLPASIDELPWRRMAPGIKQYDLGSEPRGKGAFKLLHLAPGMELSDHTHNDRELTYVVRGSYTDEIGTFKTGDISDLDGNHAHCPVVSAEAPCIALIATQSPVRYSGMLGRIMQPFVGI